MALSHEFLDRCRRWGEKFATLLEESCSVFPLIDMTPFGLQLEPFDAWTVEDGWRDPRTTLDALYEYLSHDPDGVAVRWTVLGCLYALSEPPAYRDEDDDWDDRYDEERKHFREVLAELVCRPDDVQLLTEARVVRWEIVNSCAVADFARVDRLCARLGELEPEKRPEHYASLGQFHFRRAQPELEPGGLSWWDPDVFPAHGDHALSLALWAVAVDEPLVASEASRARLREAAHWLQKSLDENFELPSYHRAALARCLLVDGNFQRAAEHYRGALSHGGLRLEETNAERSDELTASLYVAASRSLELSGNAEGAKELLIKCSEAFPYERRARRQLAEIYAQETEYARAYEVLDKWAETEPELQSDVWVKTLRALGPTRSPQRVERLVDEYLDSHPERLRSVEAAVSSHWPALDRLGAEARKQWLYGCWFLWWRAPGFESVEFATAAGYFARSLEFEVRGRFFVPFMSTISDPTELRADLDRARPDARGKTAWTRLLDRKGTLGDMLTELAPRQESNRLASTRFRAWLREGFPALSRELSPEEAGRITDLRNRAEHGRGGPLSRAEAEETCELCRQFVSRVTEGA